MTLGLRSMVTVDILERVLGVALGVVLEVEHPMCKQIMLLRLCQTAGFVNGLRGLAGNG